MTSILVSLALILATGCATNRTTLNDHLLRVILDPESIDQATYSSIQHSLVQSGKFIVLDRAAAFRAVRLEEERQFKSEPYRYSPKEKFSHYGKLWGAGAVIEAKMSCSQKQSLWLQDHIYLQCHQYVSLVDASSGEVIVSVQDQQEGDSIRYGLGQPPTPEWNDAVAKLVESFPKYFEDHPYDQRLKDYQSESEELSRQLAGRQ